jgi:hypothetical protein
MRKRVLIFSLVFAMLPLLVDAAGPTAAPRTFKELANQAVTVLSAAVVTIVILAVAIYAWRIASNMFKLSEGDTGAYRAFVFWGVMIIFVMVSVWGIVRVLQMTFFQTGQTSIQQSPASLLQGTF